jgi:antitoxin HicB
MKAEGNVWFNVEAAREVIRLRRLGSFEVGMLTYPVRLAPGDDVKVLLTFPDVPEASVAGASEDEVIAAAQEVLEQVLAGYVVDARPIPAPSEICGAPTISTARFSLTGAERDDTPLNR